MADVLKLVIDGQIARIAINRPEKRNAFDQPMWQAFPSLVAEAEALTAVRVIIVQSSFAGMFCAGADIDEFASRASDTAWQAANRAAIRTTQVSLARAAKPTIAVVDGDSIGGGCGIALACDIRVASTRARFGITPAKLGLIYPLHDTKLLVDLIGPGQAKRLLFTAELISAHEAFEIGLVEKLVQVDELSDAVMSLAEMIAANSPFSTGAIKTVVQRILGGTNDDDEASAHLFDAAFAGDDFIEGVSAFQQRRRPQFRDR